MLKETRSRENISGAINWYCSKTPLKNNSRLCGTRDIFQARLDTLYQECLACKILPEEDTALLVSIVGEMGNNCFDHNLGQWRDVIGCWFSWELAKPIIIIVADRGQGILNSLRRVLPDLKTEEEALKIAFEKKVSGRSPEQRGNGLKFVRSIINGHGERGLAFFSGNSHVEFGKNTTLATILPLDKMNQNEGSGTFAAIAWGQT